MKHIVLIFIVSITLLSPYNSNGQLIASMYNINRNDRVNYDFNEKHNHSCTKRIILASGALVGGVALGIAAYNQEYYIPNTNIYAVGGVMTLIATGLVLGGVNCLNHEIRIACSSKAIGINICLETPKRNKLKS